MIWLGDTYYASQKWQTSLMDGGMGFISAANGYRTSASLHVRHSSRANLWFLDGHADSWTAREIAANEATRWRSTDDNRKGGRAVTFYYYLDAHSASAVPTQLTIPFTTAY